MFDQVYILDPDFKRTTFFKIFQNLGRPRTKTLNVRIRKKRNETALERKHAILRSGGPCRAYIEFILYSE